MIRNTRLDALHDKIKTNNFGLELIQEIVPTQIPKSFKHFVANENALHYCSPLYEKF
jgi:hypothetical protein